MTEVLIKFLLPLTTITFVLRNMLLGKQPTFKYFYQ